jgi:hypothetical protein
VPLVSADAAVALAGCPWPLPPGSAPGCAGSGCVALASATPCCAGAGGDERSGAALEAAPSLVSSTSQQSAESDVAQAQPDMLLKPIVIIITEHGKATHCKVHQLVLTLLQWPLGRRQLRRRRWRRWRCAGCLSHRQMPGTHSVPRPAGGPWSAGWGQTAPQQPLPEPAHRDTCEA